MDSLYNQKFIGQRKTKSLIFLEGKKMAEIYGYIL